MIFQFSSPVPLIDWEVFYWLIPCPVFFLSSPPSLRGFSPATWLFETHQLSYRARIFLMVFRFSSSVSLIGLRDFLPGSHSLSIILHSAELAFKERSNYNSVSFGAKSSQSKSHMTTIIQNFTLVSWISTATPHLVGLLFGATVLSHPTHLTTYT